MARLTKRELIAAADAVCACYSESGNIPPWLKQMCDESLASASFGVRLAFVERIQQRCPEAIKLFSRD